MEEYFGNKGCIVLVVFNHRQMNIASFKYCALTSATDGSEDLPNPAYDDLIAESQSGLFYAVLQQRQDPPETSESEELAYYKNPITSDHNLGKI